MDADFAKAMALMKVSAERKVSPSRLRHENGAVVHDPTPPPMHPPPLPPPSQWKQGAHPSGGERGSYGSAPLAAPAFAEGSSGTDALRSMLGMGGGGPAPPSPSSSSSSSSFSSAMNSSMTPPWFGNESNGGNGGGGGSSSRSSSGGGIFGGADDGGAGAALLSMLQQQRQQSPPLPAAVPPPPPPRRPQSPTTSNGQKKVLVLLDMNGTLLLRLKGRLGKAPPTFQHAGLNYYLRAGVVELVQMLRQHPRCTLAFYTSMRESNALPAVLHITGGVRVEIYDRDYNKADTKGRKDAKSWDTMRDMDKIWSTRGRAGHGFDATSTLMVDDTDRKMRHAPRNLVRVPEFKEAAHRDDGTMATLIEYLRGLLDNCGDGDVRDYVEAVPYQP